MGQSATELRNGYRPYVPSFHRECRDCERVFYVRSEFDRHLALCRAPTPKARAAADAGRDYRGIPRRVDTTEGEIYVILALEGPARIKVGWSQDPESRLRQVSPSSPVRLQLHASWRRCMLHEEWDLHQELEDWWVHGEWFDAAALPTVEAYLDVRKRRAPTPDLPQAARVQQAGRPS